MTNKKTFTIVGLGELLWDMLPDGKKLGGAPCNFVFHSHQAGLNSYVVSAVGEDKNGDDILKTVKDLNLNSSFIQRILDFPTGTVSVELDAEGKPTYKIHENVAWDHIAWNDKVQEIASNIDAVCFGSLAQRNSISRETISSFLNHTRAKCLKVFDINLRQQFYTREIIHSSLLHANILKLNEDELPVIARFFNYEGTEEKILEQLMADYQILLIAYTKGSDKSTIIDSTGISYCEVPKVKVIDTVGAGDSFTAILVAGLLKKMDLQIIHKLATDVAAYVCTQQGATPVLPSYLLEQLK